MSKPRPKPPSIFDNPQSIGERMKEIIKEENREPSKEEQTSQGEKWRNFFYGNSASGFQTFYDNPSTGYGH